MSSSIDDTFGRPFMPINPRRLPSHINCCTGAELIGAMVTMVYVRRSDLSRLCIGFPRIYRLYGLATLQVRRMYLIYFDRSDLMLSEDLFLFYDLPERSPRHESTGK